MHAATFFSTLPAEMRALRSCLMRSKWARNNRCTLLLLNLPVAISAARLTLVRNA